MSQLVHLHIHFPKIKDLFLDDMRKYAESGENANAYYNFNSIGILEEYFNYEDGLLSKGDQSHFLLANSASTESFDEFTKFLNSYGFRFSKDDNATLMLIARIIRRKDWAQIGAADDVLTKKSIYEIASSELIKRQYDDRKKERRKNKGVKKLDSGRPVDPRPTIYGEWLNRLFNWIGTHLKIKQNKRRFILVGLLLEYGGFDELKNYYDSRKTPSKQKKILENGETDLSSSVKKYEDYIVETLKRIYYKRGSSSPSA